MASRLLALIPFLLVWGWSFGAVAQVVTTDYALTVGSTTAVTIQADATRKTLVIHNATASTASIAFCIYAPSASACTPALNTAGSFTIISTAPFAFWPYGSAPIGNIAIIASGASTPVSVEIGR
jgi:hypothetical protein